MPSKNSDFLWLREKFGVDFTTLDRETRTLVEEIGQEGVVKLVAEGVKPSHRGTDIVTAELKLQRFVETGGSRKWKSKGARKVQDEPFDWVTKEEDEMYRKMFESE